jgi:hypothetical protein
LRHGRRHAERKAIVLIGRAGTVIGDALHLRHVLTRPVVAEDEGSLMADVVMRVEDARRRAVDVR